MARRKAVKTHLSVASICIFLGTDLDLTKSGMTDANIWVYPTTDLDRFYEPIFRGKLPDLDFYFLSSPSLKDPGSPDGPPPGHDSLEMVTLAPFEPFAPWAGGKSMRRGADYEALLDCLNPADLDPAHEAARWAQVDAFVTAHGLRRFQQAAVEGQYRYPQGMQFGGHAQAAGTRHLLALVREHLRDAQTVIWLDFHTGLGAFGDCELITGAPSGDAGYAFSQQVWPAGVKSAASGESLSTPLNGLLDRGLAAALPGGARFAFAYPEYGTWEPMRVIRAMRADNWLAHHGDRDDPTGRAIQAEMLEAFRPDSRDWERRVVDSGAELVAQALARLPGASL